MLFILLPPQNLLLDNFSKGTVPTLGLVSLRVGPAAFLEGPQTATRADLVQVLLLKWLSMLSMTNTKRRSNRCFFQLEGALVWHLQSSDTGESQAQAAHVQASYASKRQVQNLSEIRHFELEFR